MLARKKTQKIDPIHLCFVDCRDMDSTAVFIFVAVLVDLTNTEYSTNTVTNNETAMLSSEENSTLYVFVQLFLKSSSKGKGHHFWPATSI